MTPEQRDRTTGLDVSAQSAVALVGSEEQLLGLDVVRDVAVLVHTALVVTSARALNIAARDQAEVERGRANGALGNTDNYCDNSVNNFILL